MFDPNWCKTTYGRGGGLVLALWCLIGSALVVSGCDSASDELAAVQAPESTTMSPIDGQPILAVSARDFYSGTYAESVKEQLGAYGEQIAVALRAEARSAARGTSAQADEPPTVLLKDIGLTAGAQKSSGVGEAADAPSSHVVVTHPDGRTERFVLAFEPLGVQNGTARRAKAQDVLAEDSKVYLVTDPFRTYDLEEEKEFTVKGTPLTAGAKPADIMFSSAKGIVVEGDPAAEVVLLTAVPIVGGGDQPPGYLPPPPCDFEDPEVNCDDGGGGGGGNGDGDGDGDGDGGGSLYNTDFLALRTIRVNRNFDGDGTVSTKEEVQMHVQNTDSYYSQFGRENSYRFDKALWTTIASYLFGGYDANVMGPSGGPAPGTQNSYNPVPSYAYEQTFWYEVPDVNYKDTDYHFTGMDTRIWDWYLSPSTGYFVADDEDDFPLMPLTASYWRGIMVEDDDDVTTLVRTDGDWSGDVSTFDFGSGGHQTVFTKIDARGQWFGTSDRVFQESGFRRANQENVNERTGYGSHTAPALTNGFKYVFVRKTIQPFDP